MRRLLLLVCTIIFVDALLFTALTPLVPGYADEFGLSKVGAGLLVAAFGAGALLGGIPGGLVAARFGPKYAVVGGLVLLAIASFVFALAGGAVALGVARLVQGLSSTITWAGALSWVSSTTPKNRRGEALGFAFGVAVARAIIGPMFGGAADAIGIRVSFATLGVVAGVLAVLALVGPAARGEPLTADGLARALRDRRFVGGLFFAAGFVEVVINPILGRVTDRRGRLLPIRVALTGSLAVATLLAVATEPAVIALLVGAAAITFGAMYTPSMALTSHRADAAGLPQGLAFGIMNSAWALGALVGPALGGGLGETLGDAAPYLVGAGLCFATLAATWRVGARGMRPREA